MAKRGKGNRKVPETAELAFLGLIIAGGTGVLTFTLLQRFSFSENLMTTLLVAAGAGVLVALFATQTSAGRYLLDVFSRLSAWILGHF